MDNALVITVPTGRNSVYRFIKKAGLTDSIVELEMQSEGADDMSGHHYHTFEGRGATALLRLIERFDELEKFFHAVEQIAITDYFGGRHTGFVERDDLDPEDDPVNYEAFELVAQMVEERRAAEEAKEGRVSRDPRDSWVRD